MNNLFICYSLLKLTITSSMKKLYKKWAEWWISSRQLVNWENRKRFHWNNLLCLWLLLAEIKLSMITWLLSLAISKKRLMFKISNMNPQSKDIWNLRLYLTCQFLDPNLKETRLSVMSRQVFLNSTPNNWKRPKNKVASLLQTINFNL
jgi:hypothetical protein